MIVPKLQAPIVLVHGFFGYSEIRVGPWTLANYFPGIPALLRAAGNRVLLPSLSPTRGVARRAAELKAFLNREAPGEPVHILAHSMGGLDARYMISRLNMGQRVLSLTTLGTPHRGSSFADWGIRRLRHLVRPVLNLFGVPTQGFYDLTTAGCRTFNEQVRDVPGVRYFSVAGRYDDRRHYSPEWLLSHPIVLKAEGPNDGVVSEASARYGESLDLWDGDHFSLVNWAGHLTGSSDRRRDRSQMYVPLVRRLADEGF